MPTKQKRAADRSHEPVLPVLSPDNLPYQLYLLVQSLTRKMQSVLNEFDLTPLHWGILCCLWTEDGLATQAIGKRLEQLGGTITVGLDALEKRKLIRRQSDEADQRISRVYLTAAGMRLESALIPKVSDLLGTIFAGTSAKEYKALTNSVSKLRRHLAET